MDELGSAPVPSGGNAGAGTAGGRSAAEPMTESDELTARQELARLRAENEQLHAMVARLPIGKPRRRRRVGRWSVATVFLLIGCLLLPVGAVALWARTIVFNTDRYVAAVAPLAHNPAVQDAAADRITNAVFAAIDIDGFTQQALAGLVQRGAPAGVMALQKPLVNGVRSFTHAQIHNAVSSDAFARAWEQANRAAHAGLVAALKGTKGGTIEVQNGTVSVNLGAFIATIKPQLVAAGVPFADRIPAVNLSFPILRSDKLPKIQRAARWLDTLAIPLVVLAFLMLAVAVWLAPGRRRMLSIAGLGMALSILILLGALAVGRGYYLDHLPAGSSSDAAAAVWDALMGQFRVRLQTVIAVGLVIAVSAWIIGSGQLARALRTAGNWLILSSRLGARRLGWRTNVVDLWVAAHVAALRAGAVALIIAVYAFWTRPTGAVVFWLALALLVLMAGIELLRKGADLPPAEPPSSATPAVQGAAQPGT